MRHSELDLESHDKLKNDYKKHIQVQLEVSVQKIIINKEK